MITKTPPHLDRDNQSVTRVLRLITLPRKFSDCFEKMASALRADIEREKAKRERIRATTGLMCGLLIIMILLGINIAFCFMAARYDNCAVLAFIFGVIFMIFRDLAK